MVFFALMKLSGETWFVKWEVSFRGKQDRHAVSLRDKHSNKRAENASELKRVLSCKFPKRSTKTRLIEIY